MPFNLMPSTPPELAKFVLGLSEILQSFSILTMVIGGMLLCISGIFGVSTTTYTVRRLGGRFILFGFVFAIISALGIAYHAEFLNARTAISLWLIILFVALSSLGLFQSLLALFLGWRTASSITSSIVVSAISLFGGVFTGLIKLLKPFLRY